MSKNVSFFSVVIVLLLFGLAVRAEAGEWSWGPFTFSFEAKVELPKPAAEQPQPIYRTEGVYASYGYGGTATSGGPTGSWHGWDVRDGKVVPVHEKIGPTRRR